MLCATYPNTLTCAYLVRRLLRNRRADRTTKQRKSVPRGGEGSKASPNSSKCREGCRGSLLFGLGVFAPSSTAPGGATVGSVVDNVQAIPDEDWLCLGTSLRIMNPCFRFIIAGWLHCVRSSGFFVFKNKFWQILYDSRRMFFVAC